ncbi:MAG: hypothetical protein IKD92_07115 [Lachnospiraceae bacterium]|nr:hypothetical protein [Lachnospiraceae bacterium]
MKFGKWVFILVAFCLLSALTPAMASAGETGSQNADQVQEETVTEEETADQVQEGTVTEEETADRVQEGTVTEDKTADRVQEETAAEEVAGAPAQAEETAQQDARSILLHIPFVCLIMAIVLTGFILWGKNQEKKEKQ